jgi:hypothetical protein
MEEKDSDADQDPEAIINPMKEKMPVVQENQFAIGQGSAPPAGFENQFIYDWKSLLEVCTKLSSPNFSANPGLSWGTIKLQL